MRFSLNWLLKRLSSSTLWSKESRQTRSRALLRRPSRHLISRTTDTSLLALSVEVTRGSFRSLWPSSVTRPSFCWMSPQLEWIPKLVASCGRLSKRSPNVTRNRQSFWRRTLWKKQKPWLPRWESWSVVESSAAWEVLNTSRISSELAMKSKSRLRRPNIMSLKNLLGNLALKETYRLRSISNKLSKNALQPNLMTLSLTNWDLMDLELTWLLNHPLTIVVKWGYETCCSSWMRKPMVSTSFASFLTTLNRLRCLSSVVNSSNSAFPKKAELLAGYSVSLSKRSAAWAFRSTASRRRPLSRSSRTLPIRVLPVTRLL